MANSRVKERGLVAVGITFLQRLHDMLHPTSNASIILGLSLKKHCNFGKDSRGASRSFL